VTSKGVPLGYPLLRTGERLEKHIYHARRRRRPGLGLGFSQNDVYPEASGYIQLRNKTRLLED